MKARKSWSCISGVLCAENASPHNCGVFYKATVQAALLFGSESWNLTPLALKCLEGFHIRSARCMMSMMPKKNASMGAWIYLESAVVLEKASLHTIAQYIQVRQQTIVSFIMNRSILNLCREGEDEGL